MHVGQSRQVRADNNLASRLKYSGPGGLVV